jgi:GNAT superfamily N-acetyltransferase
MNPSTSKEALTIRPARRSDLGAILELAVQDSFADPPEPASPTEEHFAAFDAIEAHTDHQLVVGTIADEVIATLQLSFLPGLSNRGAWRAQVESVRVRRDLRSSGIGGAMMNWVIDRSRERGCWIVQLTTNRSRLDAQRFYERLGFKPSHVGMKLRL